jgi:hypothetical protein
MGPSQTPVTNQTCFWLLDESREADGHAAAGLSISEHAGLYLNAFA